MTEEEALEAVKQTIAPECLSHVQEIVFKQSWAGQLCPEIAQSVGYHPEYLRDVGAQLWRSLSEGIGQKVTKKSVRFVLDTLFKNNLLPPGSGQLMQLHSLVAGHLYLIQLTLYWLSKREITLSELLKNAHTQSGIYSAHLRRHWQTMQRSPELKSALVKVLKAEKQGAKIDALLACQLERMGLVRITGNAAAINSKLYYLYFSDLLLA